jgi:hypothetical protein
MFFLLPSAAALLELVGTVIVSTLAAKATSDLYDEFKSENEPSQDPDQA